MSEFSTHCQNQLVTHLVDHGIPEPWARDLVAENASIPVVESGEWVLLDRAGKEVVRVPEPAGFR